MRLLLFGLIIAAAVYLLSEGSILFLPLLFFVPLGLFGARRRRRRGGFGMWSGSFGRGPRYGRW